MDVNRLRGKLIEKSITIAVAADRMDLSRSTLYKKLHKPHLITIDDAKKLKDMLNLTDAEAIDIFLT